MHIEHSVFLYTNIRLDLQEGRDTNLRIGWGGTCHYRVYEVGGRWNCYMRLPVANATLVSKCVIRTYDRASRLLLGTRTRDRERRALRSFYIFHLSYLKVPYLTVGRKCQAKCLQVVA